MHEEPMWPTPSLRPLDTAQVRVTRLGRLRVLGQRLGARVVAFARELDRGIAVMYGHEPPAQPRPAELDTLARTRVLHPPTPDRRISRG